MRHHFLGPAVRHLRRPHIGCVPPGDAAHADLLDRLDHATHIILRAHVEEAGRAATQHLCHAEARADDLVLTVDGRIEGLCPQEDPGTGRKTVGKNRAR